MTSSGRCSPRRKACRSTALAARIRAAVAEVVKKQVEAGIDLVNDGEMSKPSYATYVKDRLTGFAGSSNTFVYQDLAEFPNLAKRVFSDPGRSRRRTPACTAPIGVGDPAAPLADIDNLKTALAGVNAAGAFLSAASPGVISLFFRNDHYANQEAYLFGSRRRCGASTRRSPRPGSSCRSTALPWRWVGTSNTPICPSRNSASGRGAISRR
jgi:hypothetical protein